MPGVEFLHAIGGVHGVVVPFRPISAVRVTGGDVRGVTEEEVAGVEGAKLRVSVVGGRFGLNKVPPRPECVGCAVLNEEKAVLALADGGLKGSRRRGGGARGKVVRRVCGSGRGEGSWGGG